MLHTEYYKYINNLLEPESDKTSQSFWKYIKSRKQDSVSIGTLKDSGRIAESAKDKAEVFNETFCSVFMKEDLDNIPDKGHSPVNGEHTCNAKRYHQMCTETQS